MRNHIPNMAKNVSAIVVVPTLNAGLEKKRKSSMGVGHARSHAMNATTAAAATTNPAIVSGSVHPSSGPSMIPNNNAPSPTIDSSAPSRSKGAPLGSLDVGTSTATSASAIAVIGTLTKKTEPHQKWFRSHPLPMMPMAAPDAAKPAQMAIARARSCGGNTAARMLSVPGMIERGAETLHGADGDE